MADIGVQLHYHDNCVTTLAFSFRTVACILKIEIGKPSLSLVAMNQARCDSPYDSKHLEYSCRYFITQENKEVAS